MVNVDIEQLADALAPRIALRTCPEALWAVEEVAEYLRCGVAQVRDRLSRAADFPRPIRLPTPTGRSRPRWVAREIRDWALDHQERR